jgi:hypothetical protein
MFYSYFFRVNHRTQIWRHQVFLFCIYQALQSPDIFETFAAWWVRLGHFFPKLVFLFFLLGLCIKLCCSTSRASWPVWKKMLVIYLWGYGWLICNKTCLKWSIGCTYKNSRVFCYVITKFRNIDNQIKADI